MIGALALAVLLTSSAQEPDVTPPSPQERAALDALKKLGFHATSWPEPGWPPETVLQYRPNPKPKPPAVLTTKDLAPLKQLPRTRKLRLEDAPIGNDVIALLDGMSELRELDVSGTRLDDTGLKKLPGFKKLGMVILSRTEVTDAGLADLARLPALHYLWARNIKATDACFKSLATYPALTALSLGGCASVTGSGLTAFEGNEKLWALDLSDTTVGDAVVPSLRKLPGLDRLSLHRTKLTDKGFIELAKPGALPKLTLLGIIETGVSDEGLKVLHDAKALPALKSMHVERTGITAKGAKLLTMARPNIHPSPY